MIETIIQKRLKVKYDNKLTTKNVNIIMVIIFKLKKSFKDFKNFFEKSHFQTLENTFVQPEHFRNIS